MDIFVLDKLMSIAKDQESPDGARISAIQKLKFQKQSFGVTDMLNDIAGDNNNSESVRCAAIEAL